MHLAGPCDVSTAPSFKMFQSLYSTDIIPWLHLRTIKLVRFAMRHVNSGITLDNLDGRFGCQDDLTRPEPPWTVPHLAQEVSDPYPVSWS